MITILLALASVIADPGNKPDPATTAAPVAAATTAPAASADEPARRYCINDTLTGSRMAKKVCLTRKEWQQRGVTLR
jgi:hypothetical protein